MNSEKSIEERSESKDVDEISRPVPLDETCSRLDKYRNAATISELLRASMASGSISPIPQEEIERLIFPESYNARQQTFKHSTFNKQSKSKQEGSPLLPLTDKQLDELLSLNNVERSRGPPPVPVNCNRDTKGRLNKRTTMVTKKSFATVNPSKRQLEVPMTKATNNTASLAISSRGPRTNLPRKNMSAQQSTVQSRDPSTNMSLAEFENTERTIGTPSHHHISIVRTTPLQTAIERLRLLQEKLTFSNADYLRKITALNAEHLSNVTALNAEIAITSAQLCADVDNEPKTLLKQSQRSSRRNSLRKSMLMNSAKKVQGSPSVSMDPKLQQSIKMYNDLRCEGLRTPKTTRKSLINGKGNLSTTIQNQCLLLMDTPKAGSSNR